MYKALILCLILLPLSLYAQDDEVYDFYNPPPSYKVIEGPNKDGDLHFMAYGIVHDHMECGEIADIWAKDYDTAKKKLSKLIAFPGKIICANGQTLPISGFNIERVAEWRIGKPKPNESTDVYSRKGDLTKDVIKRMQKPGWVLDYRDKEELSKDDLKNHIWMDRLASSRKYTEEYLHEDYDEYLEAIKDRKKFDEYLKSRKNKK
jgi:hypothetical protein